MKKEGKNNIDEVDLSATTATTMTKQASIQQNDEEFVVQNGDVYPHRLICHLKIRMKAPQLEPVSCKGSGCMIFDGYFLTSAHNLILIESWNNRKLSWKEHSYVIQGLDKKKQGSQRYISKFSIQDHFINPSYQKKIVFTQEMNSFAENLAKQISKSLGEKPQELPNRIKKTIKSLQAEMQDMQDFAILKIKPEAQQLKEQYMPVVVISEQTFVKCIKNISIFGYPVDFSKQKSPDNKEQSSVYINCLYGNSMNWKKFERNCITYDNRTQGGISGAPIIAQFNGKFIIIGIHKGGSRQDKMTNVGVGAGQMIESLNEIGYHLQKKPFVFTEKTMHLHGQSNEIESREILFLMDKGFGPMDMLVYTAYDLNKVQKILLSGNEIGDHGVQYLLRRKYPNLHALFLTQNKIRDLSKIEEENWKNVESLTVLGLSVNELTHIPEGFLHLKKLQKLWLNHNQIKDISPTIVQLCKQINRESFTVYLHTNSINLENEKEVIEQLKQLKTRIVLQKQGVNA